MTRLARFEKERQALALIGALVATLNESARRIERTTGLTNAQAFFLCELMEAGSLTIGQLSERSVTRQSTASLLVRRLADQALVRRQRAVDDERRVVVTLTAKGRRIAKRAPPTPMKRMIKALGDVEPTRLRDLGRIGALLTAMNVPDRAEILFEPR